VNVFSQNTNQQIVELKTIEMLDSIALKLPDSLTVIAFEINTNSREIKSLLLNQFAQYFANKKVTVSLDTAAFKVVFENVDMLVEYHETNRGMLGFNNKIIRNIFFRADGYIIDNLRMDIIDTIQIDTIHNDVVNTSDISRIENSRYSFCHGNRITASRWTKYIEPGIVIASVAGVVLLLFTMRF